MPLQLAPTAAKRVRCLRSKFAQLGALHPQSSYPSAPTAHQSYDQLREVKNH